MFSKNWTDLREGRHKNSFTAFGPLWYFQNPNNRNTEAVRQFDMSLFLNLLDAT
jgi:hypothetical protein